LTHFLGGAGLPPAPPAKVPIMEMPVFYQVLDPYLIWFYRITGHAGVDIVIGTLALAVVALLIGELSSFLALRLTRKRVDRYVEEADRYQSLSMDALRAGDKEAYRATNRLANDAFGHSFFQQLTLSAAFLWPVFFALAWMQFRFLNIEIPIPGTKWSLGFIGAFIIIYVSAYFLMKRLPWLGRIRETIVEALTGTH
jgi:hypothetical protein